MIVKLLVVVSFDVASRKHCLDVLQELGVNCHHIFEVAMLRAIFDHPDLAIALDNLCLNLPNFFIN